MQTRLSDRTKGPPTMTMLPQDPDSWSQVSPGEATSRDGGTFRSTEQSTPPKPSLQSHTPAANKAATIQQKTSDQHWVDF